MGKEKNPLKAAIDIGSNTVLLLVGKMKGKEVELVYEDQYAPRLGKGVDDQQNLSEEAMCRVIDVLKKYASILDKKFPEVDEVFVTATSAVRDANNKSIFIERVKQETGFGVQVLTGDEEAAHTFFGAKSTLGHLSGSCCVLDIGGGSTEVAIGGNHILKEHFSYNIGSVRFSERYLFDDPPTEEQLNTCRAAIKEGFKMKIFHLPTHFELIGVAGTVTSLAHIRAGFKTYRPKKINGQKLTLLNVCKQIEEFTGRSSAQILESYPHILKGREDVILGGLLILESFMKEIDIPELIVSTGGIRHGALVLNKK